MNRLHTEFLKVLTKWPASINKNQKDLGEYLRNRIERHISTPNSSPNPSDSQLKSLLLITNNHNRNKYNLSLYKVGVTGLNLEDCRRVLAAETGELTDFEIDHLLNSER